MDAPLDRWLHIYKELLRVIYYKTFPFFLKCLCKIVEGFEHTVIIWTYHIALYERSIKFLYQKSEVFFHLFFVDLKYPKISPHDLFKLHAQRDLIQIKILGQILK